MKRTAALWVVWVIALLALSVGATAQEKEEAQAQYKASLIMKLIEYVSWPEGSGPTDGEPIIIGVIGDSPLQAKLEQLANFSSLSPKPQVKLLTKDDDMSSIHVAFLSTHDESELKETLTSFDNMKVLTLSDSEGFVELGVMVNFIQGIDAKSKQKFEVNLPVVKHADMKISSKFLKLARIHEG